MYWFTWALVKFIFPFIFPIKVCGRENLPKRTPFILACNHKSNIDPMIVPICCCFKMGFVAKEELFRKKFLGWLLPQLGAIPIRRGASDVYAIKSILKQLKSGKPMLIFPEGTRVVEETERKVQAGVGFIVAKSQAPVVPVYIEGTDKVMPPGTKALKRHLVKVMFGKPLDMSYDRNIPYDELAVSIMQKILEVPQQFETTRL